MAAHKHKASKVHHKHQAKHAHHAKPKGTLWLFGGVIIVGIVLLFSHYAVANNTIDITEVTKPVVSATEQERIDQWIKDENLNAYGDQKGTVYIGGTPLFNEATGKYKNLYLYIIEVHPDRPWNN